MFLIICHRTFQLMLWSNLVLLTQTLCAPYKAVPVHKALETFQHWEMCLCLKENAWKSPAWIWFIVTGQRADFFLVITSCVSSARMLRLSLSVILTHKKSTYFFQDVHSKWQCNNCNAWRTKQFWSAFLSGEALGVRGPEQGL